MSTLQTTFIQKLGAGTDAFEIPANDGTSGQYLQTDGTGGLSWQTVASLSNAEDGAGTDFEFNSGFGSNATAFGVRAWINFDGGAATIGTGRASGNMDAVTDNGVGDYTLNFTNDMPDANYALLTAGERGATNYNVAVWSQNARTVGSVDIWSVIMNAASAPVPWDIPGVFVAIVR